MQASIGGPSPAGLPNRLSLRRQPAAPRARPERGSLPLPTSAATSVQPDWQSRLQSASLAALAACVLVAAPLPPSALATDNAKVGSCVLRNCQAALATCLGDAQCLENLVCLQTCSGRPDETECQIKCGDRYADKAIDVFNTCAVSEKKCVPQKVDTGECGEGDFWGVSFYC